MKKIAVVIPCMNRQNALRATLPAWLSQRYVNAQIVIVDYWSKHPVLPYILPVLEKFGASYTYNEPGSEAAVSVFRTAPKSHFNMSHAINYGAYRTSADVFSIAGCDSLPVDYYLNVVANCLTDDSIVRCRWGRLSIPFKIFQTLNGYPELLEYWGGEDGIMAMAGVRSGYSLLDINYTLCQNIDHYQQPSTAVADHDRNGNRGNVDVRTGVAINCHRYNNYVLSQSWVNNYGEVYGQEDPILIRNDIDVDNITPLSRQAETRMHIPPVAEYVGKQADVLIDFKDTAASSAILRAWLSQPYLKKRIIVRVGSDAAEQHAISLGNSYGFLTGKDWTNQVVVCMAPGIPWDAFINMAVGLEVHPVLVVAKDELPEDYELELIINKLGQHCQLESPASISVPSRYFGTEIQKKSLFDS